MEQLLENQPFTVTLQDLRVELLRACPLLCVHCSAYAAPHHAVRLPFERVLTLIDEFAEGGGRRITFTGGEPLMYAGLEEILQRCRERALGTRLFSSGIIFEGTERAAGVQILKQCGHLLDTVMYSVYSTSAETHDQITRIPGSLRLTLDAIKHTVALNIRAEIHFVPTLKNYRELPDIVALAARLQVPKVGVLRFVPHGRGKSRADSLALGKEEHVWLRKEMLELRKRYPSTRLYVGPAYNLLSVDAPQPCTAGINQLVVEADGSIAPCSAFSNVAVKDRFGNILRQPLQTVWRQSLYLQQVRQALAQVHSCSTCLAQKTIVAGRIDSQVQDPLSGLLL
jgi:radical SAM protein with 4Fe4S-binding SPASM domain